MHSVEVSEGAVLDDSVVPWIIEESTLLTQWLPHREPLARQEVALDGLEALRQAVQRAEENGSYQRSIRRETASYLDRLEALGNHAAPLAPLRDRDLLALQDWFQPLDMAMIEVDIVAMLRRLVPEPAWEEDTWLELLHEFL